MKAIVSDIHANVAAMEVVLKDIQEHGIGDDQTISLGDLVGYGPQPIDVVDRAMAFRINLMGNHDEAVVFEPHGFNFRALTAIRWTKKKMETRIFGFSNKKRVQFIKDMKITHREDGVLFVHGSPREPTTEYILRADVEDANSGRNPDKLKAIFAQIDSLCVVGHTHIPCVIEQVEDPSGHEGFHYNYYTEKDLDYEFVFSGEEGRKYVLNAGSVGQPRDGDTRACYILWDDGTFRWRRLEYDFKKTAGLIRKIKELDDYNAERLEMGV